MNISRIHALSSIHVDRLKLSVTRADFGSFGMVEFNSSAGRTPARVVTVDQRNLVLVQAGQQVAIKVARQWIGRIGQYPSEGVAIALAAYDRFRRCERRLRATVAPCIVRRGLVRVVAVRPAGVLDRRPNQRTVP